VRLRGAGFVPDNNAGCPRRPIASQYHEIEQHWQSPVPETENFSPVSVVPQRSSAEDFSTSSESFSSESVLAAAAPVAVSLPTNASGATGTTVTIPITVGTQPEKTLPDLTLS